jgi:hypothetical protein
MEDINGEEEIDREDGKKQYGVKKGKIHKQPPQMKMISVLIIVVLA